MNRRSLLRSALLAPVAWLAAKLGARAAEPMTCLLCPEPLTEGHVCKRLVSGPADLYEYPKVTQYKMVNGELAELIHPYDVYELFNDYPFTKLVDLRGKEPDEILPDGAFRTPDGKLYWMSTAVPPRTKRFA